MPFSHRLLHTIQHPNHNSPFVPGRFRPRTLRFEIVARGRPNKTFSFLRAIPSRTIADVCLSRAGWQKNRALLVLQTLASASKVLPTISGVDRGPAGYLSRLIQVLLCDNEGDLANLSESCYWSRPRKMCRWR